MRARMQMVFQNPLAALNPRRTILASVAAPLRARGDRAQVRGRAVAALELAGLSAALAGRYPHQLSGGQRQRVGIARAIVTEPEFILADEIVSGLDVATQAQILDLLRTLRREMGLALGFIAHDLSVVRVLCERVAVMHQGRIVEEGPCERVFADARASLHEAIARRDPAAGTGRYMARRGGAGVECDAMMRLSAQDTAGHAPGAITPPASRQRCRPLARPRRSARCCRVPPGAVRDGSPRRRRRPR